jgi:hypothetical protein
MGTDSPLLAPEVHTFFLCLWCKNFGKDYSRRASAPEIHQ